MTRSGKMRLAASLVTVVWICLEIWAVGPVMRESDQASLLEGAVQLAVGDKALSDNDSYNYDKQYFSYWVTAAWFKLRSPSAEDSMVIVREGNLLAVTLFALALLSGGGFAAKVVRGAGRRPLRRAFHPRIVLFGDVPLPPT